MRLNFKDTFTLTTNKICREYLKEKLIIPIILWEY